MPTFNPRWAMPTILLAGLACQDSLELNAEPSSQQHAAEATPSSPPAGKPLKLKSDGLEKLNSKQLARRMVAATGGNKLTDQIIAAMGQQLAQVPNVEAMLEEMRKGIPELIEQMLPIYTKHLTKQEMIQLIRFYESPTGKAFVLKQPMIVQDSMQIAQAWAQKALASFLPPTP